MGKIKVWTKQHESVLKKLNETGRYLAKREYIVNDLEEHADLVLEVYDWFVKKAATKFEKPQDVTYPIWLSLKSDATMMKSPHTVVMEFEIEESMIMPVNIDKWGTMLNYSYIPLNESDKKRHKEVLLQYGIDDQKAYMTQFYPQIKREIIDSWDRLFDDTIILNNDEKYGTIWELKKEWLIQTIE